MPNRKASLYAVLLIALTACTKQNTIPMEKFVQTKAVSNIWLLKPKNPNQNSNESVFGLTQEKTPGKTPQKNIDETMERMNEADVNITRVQIALSQTSVNKIIDAYLTNGYNVQIIVNWDDGKNGTRDFPTDTEMNLLKANAEAFFKYYAPYKNQIPFVAFENEWDWQVMHGAKLQNYLSELTAVTNIGHQYGFKVADGGITGTSLQRWTYSQLSGNAREKWIANYWVGLDSGYKYYNYNALMNIINTYITGIQNINLDYTNVHWYNAEKCANGFGTATQKFLNACNKNIIVCNEFYIGINSLSLFNSTVNEIQGSAKYAVAYSGNEDDKLAIKLTDDMLDNLNE